MRAIALAVFLTILPATAAAAPSKAELQAELAAILTRIQSTNKKAAEAGTAGTPDHGQRMLTLINRMQELQLALAGKAPPPATSDAAKRNRDTRRYLDTQAAMNFFEQGETERGINVLESLTSGPLTSENVGAALFAANHYLDLLADAERGLTLGKRALRSCRKSLAAGEGDPATMEQYRRNARQVIARCLAPLGRKRELTEHLAESEAGLARFEARVGPPRTEAELIDLATYGFQVATEWMHHDDPSRALELIERAEERLANWPDQGALQILNWTNTLRQRKGEVLKRLGKIEEALANWERYFQTERELVEKTSSARGGHYYALALIEYAECLEASGELDVAIEAAEGAHQRYFGVDRENLVAGAYQALGWKPSFLLGKLYRAKGDPDKALEHFRETAKIIESLYAKLRSGKLKGSFLSFDECGAAYDHMVSIYLEKGDPAAALGVLDRSKSAVLLDMLKSQPLRERSRWPKRLLERERELKRRMRELKRDASTPSDGTRSGSPATPEAKRKVYEDYELFLRDVQEAVQAPEVATGARKVDAVWSHEPETLKKAGTGGRVVVAYFDDGETLRAFVVKDGEVRVHPAGSSKKVSRSATKLRRNVTARSRRWSRTGQRLYEDLVAPWESALEGATELVVVPTGELFALPFGALPDSDDTPLAARVPLSFVSQLSLLAEATAPTRARTGALVIADPDGSLPNARLEGAQVAKAAGEGANVLEGEAATEGALKARVGFLRDAPAPGTLHLATHGLLDKGAHLLSSLVLSPDDIEDGALTFAEIFNDLDLRQTPVVVLSACNTAVGETRGGDEVAGLARAFQYAGAEWVVASLWEVSDKASAALMTKLHEGLAAGLPVDQALQKAQLAIQQQDEDWKHPYFWAAFAAYRR